MASQQKDTGYTIQRPQAHVFEPVTLANITDPVNINIRCPFPVKEIRINMAYHLRFDDVKMLTVHMPNLVPDQCVGVISNLSLVNAAGEYWYADSLRESSVVSYVFREPQIIYGAYPLTLAATFGAGVFQEGALVLHFNLLG